MTAAAAVLIISLFAVLVVVLVAGAAIAQHLRERALQRKMSKEGFEASLAKAANKTLRDLLEEGGATDE